MAGVRVPPRRPEGLRALLPPTPASAHDFGVMIWRFTSPPVSSRCVVCSSVLEGILSTWQAKDRNLPPVIDESVGTKHSVSILSLFHAPRCCDGPGSVSAGSHAGAWAVKHRGGYPQSSRSRCPLPPHRALAATSRSRSQGVPVERGKACEDHRQSLPRFPSIVPVERLARCRYSRAPRGGQFPGNRMVTGQLYRPTVAARSIHAVAVQDFGGVSRTRARTI